MKFIPKITLLGLCIFALNIHAQNNILTEIENIKVRDVRVEGFKLSSDQTVEINAIGFTGSRRHNWMFTRAWILDAATRDVVWDMSHKDPSKEAKRLLYFDEELFLPAGSYEVYYSSFPQHIVKDFEGVERFFSGWFNKWFEKKDNEDLYHAFGQDIEKFKIVVRGKGKRVYAREVEQLRDSFLKNAIVKMTGLLDETRLNQGFRLDKGMDLELYAIGEIRKDGSFDYGWILDKEKHEKVWALTLHNSRPAGGARKNRLSRESIFLPEGDYAAFFVTDDSHSNSAWNQAPPNDPDFWGLTLKVKEHAMKKYVHHYDFKDVEDKNIIVKCNKLRDNEFVTKQIKCIEDTKVRIYAVGEGRRRAMYDYSWIVDVKTHEKIWEMNYYNTEHAGGSSKNRIFDGIVTLPKGNYVVYAITDDSHSYWEWNDAPPYDPENWGIKILAVDNNNGNAIEVTDKRDMTAIVQLVKIGDNERERKRFTQKRDGNVGIYALGEGAKGSMYDYSWIEDAETGRTIWEMEYDKTEHAGGASKNRFFDGIIFLKRGDYIVYYNSDDSHSYADWNSSPPNDPASWGITIYAIE